MANFQGRRLKSKWRQRLVVALLVLVFLGMGRGVWSLIQKNRLARENFQEAAHKLEDLERERASLVTTVDILKTNRGIEAEIRKNYSVVKEGEHVIAIVDGTDSGSSTDNGANKKKHWWQVWANIF